MHRDVVGLASAGYLESPLNELTMDFVNVERSAGFREDFAGMSLNAFTNTCAGPGGLQATNGCRLGRSVTTLVGQGTHEALEKSKSLGKGGMFLDQRGQRGVQFPDLYLDGLDPASNVIRVWPAHGRDDSTKLGPS